MLSELDEQAGANQGAGRSPGSGPPKPNVTSSAPLSCQSLLHGGVGATLAPIVGLALSVSSPPWPDPACRWQAPPSVAPIQGLLVHVRWPGAATRAILNIRPPGVAGIFADQHDTCRPKPAQFTRVHAVGARAVWASVSVVSTAAFPTTTTQ